MYECFREAHWAQCSSAILHTRYINQRYTDTHHTATTTTTTWYNPENTLRPHDKATFLTIFYMKPLNTNQQKSASKLAYLRYILIGMAKFLNLERYFTLQKSLCSIKISSKFLEISNIFYIHANKIIEWFSWTWLMRSKNSCI